MSCSRVVLPLPLGPMMPSVLPRCDVQRDVLQGGLAVVGEADAIDADHVLAVVPRQARPRRQGDRAIQDSRKTPSFQCSNAGQGRCLRALIPTRPGGPSGSPASGRRTSGPGYHTFPAAEGCRFFTPVSSMIRSAALAREGRLHEDHLDVLLADELDDVGLLGQAGALVGQFLHRGHLVEAVPPRQVRVGRMEPDEVLLLEPLGGLGEVLVELAQVIQVRLGPRLRSRPGGRGPA